MLHSPIDVTHKWKHWSLTFTAMLYSPIDVTLNCAVFVVSLYLHDLMDHYNTRSNCMMIYDGI